MDRKKSPKNLFLSKLFTEEELSNLTKSITKGIFPVDDLLKILKRRAKDTELRPDLIKEPTYAVQRAYLDGRYKELSWLIQLLKQEEDSDHE